jgi:hypothetical protein
VEGETVDDDPICPFCGGHIFDFDGTHRRKFFELQRFLNYLCEKHHLDQYEEYQDYETGES